MPNYYKNFLHILRTAISKIARIVKVSPPGSSPAYCQSTEGWELVDDLSTAGGVENTGNQPTGTPQPHGRSMISSLPPYAVVWAHFVANGYPVIEARRFYKRYQLLGWNQRIIPTLANWPQLADHWMRQVRQPPANKHKKPPNNDAHSGNDTNPARPV